MDHSTYRGLAFLLSLGTLPLACKPDEGTTESGTGTTTGPGTSTDGGSSGGTSTTTDTTAGSTGGSGSGSGATEPTGGDPTGGPGGICEQYGAFYITCDPAGDMTQLVMDCEAIRKEREGVYGPACLALYDTYLACIIGGTCDDTGKCDAEAMAAYYCMPEIGPICQAYGAKYMECMLGAADESAQYCQIGLNTSAFQYGPACGTAYEEMLACFNALDCAAFEEKMGCEAQMMALQQACS